MISPSPVVVSKRYWIVDGLTIVLTTILMAALFFSLPPLDVQLKLALVSVVLVAWWRLGGLALLLFLQFFLLFTEPPELSFVVNWSSVTFPTLSLILLAIIERTLAARRHTPKSNWRDQLANFQQVLRQPLDLIISSTLASLSLLVAGVLVSVAVAFTILWFVPLDPAAAGQVRLRPAELRGIFLATVLVGLSVGTAIIIGELKWRDLTASQARVYLRGHLANWLEIEWRTVILRRIRKRLAASKHNQKKTLYRDTIASQVKTSERSE